MKNIRRFADARGHSPCAWCGRFPSGFLVNLRYEEQPSVLIVMLPVIEMVDKNSLAVSGPFLEPQVNRHIPGYLFPVSSHIGERCVLEKFYINS